MRVKDAIVDRLRQQLWRATSVVRDRPIVRIKCRVERSSAQPVALDLSGEPLHKRGYRRAEGVEAPLKETLAATMILAAGWDKPWHRDSLEHRGDLGHQEDLERQDGIGRGWFIDPLCGSGTLAIEAALIALDVAPGIFRDYWGCTGWLKYDADLWDSLVEEADSRAEFAASSEEQRRTGGGMPLIHASDIDPVAIRAAEENARRAGVSAYIGFSVGDIAGLSLPTMVEGARGLLACNPPYGERLASASQLPVLYASLAASWRAAGNLDLCVITPDDRIDIYLGAQPINTISTFNGPLETQIRLYGTANAAAGMQAEPVDASQFEARLRKMAQHRAKWARRSDVSCYRVYDADLPDFAVAIDVYQGAKADEGKRYLHIAEYSPPKDIDSHVAAARLTAVLELAPAILEVPADQVFLKVRQRARGGSQYAEVSPRNGGHSLQVREGGLLFEVDLSGRLDTGIFLDHRLTRELLRSKAKGQDALNLFAYTGSASVYMAWLVEPGA